jgi:hypothetical protein
MARAGQGSRARGPRPITPAGEPVAELNAGTTALAVANSLRMSHPSSIITKYIGKYGPKPLRREPDALLTDLGLSNVL